MLPEKKGIEKSLWVKKFIKRMDYSREGITLIFYYKGLKGTDHGISASGRAKENAGRNSKLNGSKKEPGILDFGSNNAVWLRGLDFHQTISIILPNTIHSCKKKNL